MKKWTEQTPLSVGNLNQLVDAINQITNSFLIAQGKITGEINTENVLIATRKALGIEENNNKPTNQIFPVILINTDAQVDQVLFVYYWKENLNNTIVERVKWIENVAYNSLIFNIDDNGHLTYSNSITKKEA